MKRFLKGALAAVLLLVAVAAGGVYWLVSGDGIRLALEQQASGWLGQPVRIGAARGQLFPRVGIKLGDVRIGEPARVTLADVDVSTGLRALLQRRIADADVRVRNSRINLPLPFALPSGGGSTGAKGATVSGLMRIESIRSIALQNVTVASRGREIRVSASSSLVGARLELQEFSAESGHTSVRAEGLIELEPRVDAKLRVRAARLDLDELLILANAFAGAAVPGTPGTGSGVVTKSERTPDPITGLQSRIAARVSAEAGTIGGVNVSQLATDFQIEGDRVTLSPFTFQFFGGRYQGSLNATIGNTLSATLRSRIIDLDTAQLAAFGNAPDTITGRLSGAGTFSGSGRDFADVLNTARGTGTAEIVNGTLRRLNLVRTVVLYFGRPVADEPPSSDRFDRMDLKFSLARQVFRADAFSMRAPDSDLVGTAALTIPTKALEGRLDLSLSEALSAQAGTDLLRYTREGKRIVLPASLGGTLAAPRLTIDAAAAVKRGLRNEVERRLKDVLEGLQK